MTEAKSADTSADWRRLATGITTLPAAAAGAWLALSQPCHNPACSYGGFIRPTPRFCLAVVLPDECGFSQWRIALGSLLFAGALIVYYRLIFKRSGISSHALLRLTTLGGAAGLLAVALAATASAGGRVGSLSESGDRFTYSCRSVAFFGVADAGLFQITPIDNRGPNGRDYVASLRERCLDRAEKRAGALIATEWLMVLAAAAAAVLAMRQPITRMDATVGNER